MYPEEDRMRIEELLVDIYSQKRRMEEQKKKPTQVIMSLRLFKVIRFYRLMIGSSGDLPGDYLGEDTLFDLEIMIDSKEDSFRIR